MKPLHTLLRAATRHFEGIVSVKVADRQERERHAALMATLVGCGLAAALGMPLVAIGSGGMRAAIHAASASSFCLLLASFLAVTAAYEMVVGAAVAGAAVTLAMVGIATGGLASPFVWLLPFVALEGASILNKRAGLACIAIVSLAFALVLIAFALGWTTGSATPREWIVALGAAGFLAVRRISGLAAKPRSVPAMPEKGAEKPGRPLFRFAPGGETLEAFDLARAWFGERRDAERLPFALSAIHVADRVAYLSACGEIREGRATAACRVRLLLDADGAVFRATDLRFSAARNRGNLAAILLDALVEIEEPSREAPAGLEAELAAARAASQAKTRFLATVSHELRTPLNAIIGFSDVLDRELFGSFPDPRQKEYVGLIRQSGQHLLSVVNEILDVSKIEAGRYELEPEEFAIAEVLESVAATVRADAEAKGLRFDLVNRCRAERATGDRRAIYQAILNLAANAVKFTESGSVAVTAREEDGFLAVTVRDTGIGIPAADLAKLGQPFVQASTGPSRRYPGTGLGLSLAKGFAELHRGSLRIKSEIGRGTEVEILFGLDCADRSLHNDDEQKVVTLKHARTQETTSQNREARRSA